MLRHYLKIAFRNLWKYKSQTFVSVVGLAVGFACFAMATLWIRYEMTYDSFHANAEQMYCVFQPYIFNNNVMSRRTNYLLAGYLKSTFPEIVRSTSLSPFALYSESHMQNLDFLRIDSSFFSMFDVKIVEGNMDFLIPGTANIAITIEKAQQLFGAESPLGKRIKNDKEYTICAVVTGLSRHSNYSFDILFPFGTNMLQSSGEHTLVELVEGVDIEALKKKLNEHVFEMMRGRKENMTVDLVPLTSVRYKDPNIEREVKFQHIIIFSVAGSLLILCTLFNYLTLFISRFRIRQRELALRVVFGASNRSLFALLSVEFVASLIIALLCGIFLIQTVAQPFMELSGIRLELSEIYLESLAYLAVIILISLLTFLAVLALFRRRTLNVSIRRSNSKLFRKTSIVFQLIISIVFAFCTIIILKQMYHLHNTDLGFAIKNRGSTVIYKNNFDITALNNQIRQIPEIVETVECYGSLLPSGMRQAYKASDWTDKSENAQPVDIEEIYVSEQFMKFYEIKTVEGEMPKDNSRDRLINESAMKAFGWHTAVGKSFNNMSPVKGVIRNIYNLSPTAVPTPVCYCYASAQKYTLLFRYVEDTWKSCRKKIEDILRREYPDGNYLLSNTEEEYDRFLKSENALLKILTLISLVCIFVCVFGFVSIVSLTCEERRKEIAIRKINGATVKDILDLFFKEYLTLLVVGALIAFPVGYTVMKRWLENYVVQTEISAWIYASILLGLILTIVLCVGGKVYRTSIENPAYSIIK